MTGPTEQERREINETLARAIGWNAINEYPNTAKPTLYWVDTEGNCHEKPPDFTRDPAARDELVRWLAADDARWREFAFRLFDLVGAWPPQALDSVARKLLTADPLVIARAAVEAIGGSND